MALFTKCILDAPEPTDGMRISVMNRHTLSDGVTPDPKLLAATYTYHLPIFAPSSKLLGDWYKRGLAWEDFCDRYYREMSDPRVHIYIGRIATIALRTNVTLLCIENRPFLCHRQLLALLCRRAHPELEIHHHW